MPLGRRCLCTAAAAATPSRTAATTMALRSLFSSQRYQGASASTDRTARAAVVHQTALQHNLGKACLSSPILSRFPRFLRSRCTDSGCCVAVLRSRSSRQRAVRFNPVHTAHTQCIHGFPKNSRHVHGIPGDDGHHDVEFELPGSAAIATSDRTPSLIAHTGSPSPLLTDSPCPA